MYNNVGNNNPSGGIRLNFITTADQTKFEDLFKRATASTGGKQITAPAVRDLLTRSRLDNDSLAKIWDLSSITKAPYLTFPEFAVAMYLTSTKLTGKAIPNQLPSEVREETEIAIATLASTETNSNSHLINTNTPPIQPSTTGYPQAQIAMMTGMLPQYQQQQQQQQQQAQPQMPMMTGFQQPQQQLPMMTGVPTPQPQMPMRTGLPMLPYQPQQQIPMQTGYMNQAPLQAPMATGIGRPIQTGANKPRLQNMDFANKMMPNQASRQNLLAPVLGTHQQHAISWKISPEEKQRYREIFSAWENSGTGYLSGEVARQVFMQSGLQENDLMKIWNLADKENRGSLDVDEFAIAMHLVYRKLNNFDIPSVLPAELAPPSSVLKKFVIGHQSSPSPFTTSSASNTSPSTSSYQQRDRGVADDGYVSSARHKGPSRFMNSAPSRKMTSYESDQEDQDDYDSAAVDELRLQITTTKKKLDGLNKQQGARRSESSPASNLYSMEELKENIRKTQDQLGLAYRGNEMTTKYFQNTETLLDLLESQKSLQDEIQYLCNRDIPVLARQLRSSAAELRDAKVRFGRKNDGGQDYTAYIQPTGPGGATTESDRVRAKAKAMMAARKIGTSSSRDADYDLRRAEDEKQAYDRLADDAERDMERNREALRDIRGDLRYLDQLVESSAVLDKKRFEKGQDMSYELRRFIEQLEREAPLGFSPPSTPAVNRRGVSSSYNDIGSTSPSTSLDSPSSAPVASPSSGRAVSKPRTADEIKKEAERRVQERLDALRAKRGQSSPAARSPQPSTPKIDHEEQAAQQRLREAEQQAQARLRESEIRQEDQTLNRDNELERRRQEEMDRQRQLDEEKEMERRRQEEDQQRQVDEEKEMEERRRAILQKEEEQRLARLEALRKAEEEEEAAKNATNTQSQASIPPPPPPPPPPANVDHTPVSPPLAPPLAPPAPPAPPAPAPISAPVMDTIDETTATTTEPPKGSSNNPFAKLQQPASEQNEKSVDEPVKTTAADKRVSYNPFAAFSAFSATKGHDSDDDSEDDDGWDVVNQDDSDNDDDFPAAGSAKNLAGKLFDAMSQRQAGGGSPKPFGSPSPKSTPSPTPTPATEIPPPPPPPTAASDIPPPPPPPPPTTTSDIPPPPPPPSTVAAPSGIPPPPAPPQPTSNNDFSPPAGRNALLGQIQQGTRLKKAVTNDRSKASVSGQVLDDNQGATGLGSTVPATETSTTSTPSKPAPTEQPTGPLASGGFLAELQKRTGVDSKQDTVAPAVTMDSTDSEGIEYSALWDYDGQGADDLSFQADDVIVVNNGLESDDWWYGTLKRSKQSGYFPRNYVESKVEGGSAQGSKGIALYDYNGPEDEGCLTFEAGASLIILDKSLGDWWTAKLENGKQGLVPANYVEDQE